MRSAVVWSLFCAVFLALDLANNAARWEVACMAFGLAWNLAMIAAVMALRVEKRKVQRR